MINKYIYGTPFDTEAVVLELQSAEGCPVGFEVQCGEGITLRRSLSDDTVIYGLGENVRGINKRGYSYVSFCTDIPSHTECTPSLYAAHNFLIFSDNKDTVGLFIDCPARITFDLGFGRRDTAEITIDSVDAVIYTITGDSLIDIVSQLRALTGSSYIPPKWAFGYQQSRWGYRCAEDILEVVRRSEEIGCPLDSVYLDIDYMDNLKDFTVHPETFGGMDGLTELSNQLKTKGIRLVPIIDAGVKAEKGYDIFDEGCEKGYFCKDKEGNLFVAAVWPGHSVFPDVLNPDARRWFGSKYKRLTDCGIEGFWNDMNEPAIFYTPNRLANAIEKAVSVQGKDLGTNDFWGLLGAFDGLSGSMEDYKSFCHNTPQGVIEHDKLHNLFGYNMTRAAKDAFDEIEPDKRILLFSRASYIGMHRYSGLWTGDNCSWWSHLLLNIKMMPSLNMCGFLYSGADLGGFGCDTSEDLMMRWLQFGIFTPLMRNHSALGTKEQEIYRFSLGDKMADTVKLRYRLIPYLYSEFLKAAQNDGMLFRPLSFDYPDDEAAREIEDQLMWGESVMLAPVYEQNSNGRYVYLPEDMLCVHLGGSKVTRTVPMKKGRHYIRIPLCELVIFVRKGHLLPLADSADCVEHLTAEHLEVLGFGEGALSYELFDDDGITKSGIGCNYRVVSAKEKDGQWISNDDRLTLSVISSRTL